MIDKSDLGEEEKRVCLEEQEEQGQHSPAVGRLLQMVEAEQNSMGGQAAAVQGEILFCLEAGYCELLKENKNCSKKCKPFGERQISWCFLQLSYFKLFRQV